MNSSASLPPPASAPTTEYSESIPGAPIETVLCLGDLDKRPSRPRDHALFATASKALLAGMSSEPETVLHSLAETILKVLQCDSAGVSLINSQTRRFYWPAIAGVWAPHVGGGTPMDFGPCGDVLAAGRSLHMRDIHKRYTYFTPVAWVKEVLLVPFVSDQHIVGTIWAVIHYAPHDERSGARKPREYDREDLRLLELLGDLAGAAYQVWMAKRPPSERPLDCSELSRK